MPWYRTLREPLILLTLYLAPGLLAGSAVSPEAIPMRTLIATAVHSGAYALLILYLFDLRRERTVVLSARARITPVRFVLAAGAVAATMLVLGGAFGVLLAPVSSDPIAAPAVTMAGNYGLITRMVLLALVMAVIAYGEELFFRVYLITRFQQAGTTPGIAILTAALLFGLGHGWQGWPAILFSATSGVVLGVIWVRFRRVHVLAVGHALYNLSILLISGL